MSSHREAPQISKDPAADSTDLYAFVSPDHPTTVTLIANYIPLQLPDGGPNFFEFGDDVTYDINIDNTGTGTADITYRFNFTTVNTIPDTFLYNVGPIESVYSANWNRKQTYTLTRIDSAGTTTLLTDAPVPPCNIGPLSTPDYGHLTNQATKDFSAGGFRGRVFAGQRAEGFYVDLGAIFDLGVLRPVQELHATFGLRGTGLGKMAAGVNSTKNLNVHSLALQIPITELTASGTHPTSVSDPAAVIGVWTSASRPGSRTYPATNSGSGYTVAGIATDQVSRLANPLVNEVLIPLSLKDSWNNYTPQGDSHFVQYFNKPELATLLPVLYPKVFPKLEKFLASSYYADNGRPDIEAIFLTGLPAGIVKGFRNNLAQTGVTADELRLNVAIPPSRGKKISNLGLVGGDPAGFPNGRRVFDDVTTIELRALAGVTLPLVDPSYKPDAAAGVITPGLTSSAGDLRAKGTVAFNSGFPYLARPFPGFDAGSLQRV